MSIDALKTRILDRPADETVGERAAALYPLPLVFDTALPLEWTRGEIATWIEPRGQFVWLYPEGFSLGLPAPITLEALEYMRWALPETLAHVAHAV